MNTMLFNLIVSLSISCCIIQQVGSSTSCSNIKSPPISQPSDSKFSIGTWNLGWYFDGIDDPYLVPTITPAEHEIELSTAAMVLEQLNIDIWNLAEVEGCHILNDTLFYGENSLAKNGYNRWLVRGTDTATGQQVALVSNRMPITDLDRTETRHDYPSVWSKCGYNVDTDYRSSAVSKHYYTILDIEPFGEILVVGLHFKAYPTDPRSCAQREAQAQVIADIVASFAHANYSTPYNWDDEFSTNSASSSTVDECMKQQQFQSGYQNVSWRREVIVLGDFNDVDDILPDISKNRPTSRIFEIFRNVGLLNTADILNETSRWTWGELGAQDPRASMIDHILVSPGLFQKVSSVNVHWDDNVRLVSDHAPLTVHFDATFHRDLPEYAQAHLVDCAVENDTICELSVSLMQQELSSAQEIIHQNEKPDSPSQTTENPDKFSIGVLIGAIVASVVIGAAATVIMMRVLQHRKEQHEIQQTTRPVSWPVHNENPTSEGAKAVRYKSPMR